MEKWWKNVKPSRWNSANNEIIEQTRSINHNHPSLAQWHFLKWRYNTCAYWCSKAQKIEYRLTYTDVFSWEGLSSENATHAGPVPELCTWNWCHALGLPSVVVLHAKETCTSCCIISWVRMRAIKCNYCQLLHIISHYKLISYNFILSFWARWAVAPTFCCSLQTSKLLLHQISKRSSQLLH